jgi:ribosomal protein S18 acetylase RimI-like enzyme
VEFRYSPAVADRLPLVRRLVRKIVPGLEAMVNAEKPGNWCVELAPSCVSFVDRWWRGPAPVVRLGVDASDAELAYALGRHIMEPIMWRHPASRMLYDTSLGDEAVKRYTGLAAMRWTGFEHEAERLAEALERDSRRRYGSIDAAFYYPHGAESPGFWLWRALERQHGGGLVKRLFKAVPKKIDWEVAPSAVFTSLDRAVHFLNKATRADVAPWFEQLGATVHRLPRARWGSKGFKQGVRRAMARQLRDSSQPASERADALYALIECQHRDKRPLATAARQLRSTDPATHLLGSALLARMRDPRGTHCLRALAATRTDKALAALAALMLVDEGCGAAAARLARLAEGLDHRFQLLVGHQLERLGHRRAERFTLGGIRRADGPKAARIDVEYNGELKVFPTVDGVRAANIFSAEDVGHLPGNTHVRRWFVHWVHTAGKFRRRGLARRAMQRTLEDPRARRCSCATLGTGTRNTAHALYRSFGFVDIRVGDDLQRDLEHEQPRVRAKGIRVRAYRPGDEGAIARLFEACYGDCFGAERKRPTRLAGGPTVLLAHKGRKLVAAVSAFVSDKEAYVYDLAVAPGKKREEVVGPLMARLHARLSKSGAKNAMVWRAAEMLGPLLQPLGYVSRKRGGVGMFKLIDLPQFLEEVAPLLERRLAKSDWTGTVALCGETHRAGLTIRKGRVTVQRRPAARAGIRLEGTDAAITRVVAGIDSPFEPYLQLDLEIAPALNRRFLELLETLFPRLQQC